MNRYFNLAQAFSYSSPEFACLMQRNQKLKKPREFSLFDSNMCSNRKNCPLSIQLGLLYYFMRQILTDIYIWKKVFNFTLSWFGLAWKKSHNMGCAVRPQRYQSLFIRCHCLGHHCTKYSKLQALSNWLTVIREPSTPATMLSCNTEVYSLLMGRYFCHYHGVAQVFNWNNT